MTKVTALPLPSDSLMQTYAARDDCFTDCYGAMIGPDRGLAECIRAFYKTPLFRAERAVLRLAGRGGTDADVDALADATSDRYAAWTVEGRTGDQILLCDAAGWTRSWLCVQDRTLLFSSAVIPRKPGTDLGRLFHMLLPLHHLYARGLLRSAARQLA